MIDGTVSLSQRVPLEDRECLREGVIAEEESWDVRVVDQAGNL